MKMLLRWAKFNLVGAMGMMVQLTALALFNRWMAGHYLYASAAAIELTLLHNFVWHVRYTWRDRQDEATWLRQLVRFHLSNGLVSMLGNLALMRVLVQDAHLPAVIANGVAILGCSVANFFIGNYWAFAGNAVARRASKRSRPISIQTYTLALLLFVMTGKVAHGQTPESPSTPSSVSRASAPVPEAPRPATAHHSRASDTYLAHAGAFCSAGASTSPVATRPTAGCGAGLTFVPFPIFIEVGVMAPQANRSNFSGYISVDGSVPLARSSSTYLPLAIVGYSRLFETGHALDYGLALALPRFVRQRDDSKSLRIELRDYWTFANPAQHNVMLRVGWMVEEAD